MAICLRPHVNWGLVIKPFATTWGRRMDDQTPELSQLSSKEEKLLLEVTSAVADLNKKVIEAVRQYARSYAKESGGHPLYDREL